MKRFLKKIRNIEPILITYDELFLHPINQKLEIEKGFITERLPTVNDVVFFRVELDKNVIINPGVHDCFEEVVLYEGEVIETLTNKKLLKYKNIIIQPGKIHGFTGVADKSIFYAYLYKKK